MNKEAGGSSSESTDSQQPKEPTVQEEEAPEEEEELEPEEADEESVLPEVPENWNQGKIEIVINRCSDCYLHYEFCRH